MMSKIGKILLCFAILCVPPHRMLACGPEWFPPDDAERGFYSQTLTTIQMGTETIPLIIEFDPAIQPPSHILGPGWYCPLLESFMEEHEGFILIHAPDGTDQKFTPAPKLPHLYTNPGNWAGEKKGDTFVIYSACGWKITYVKGHITELKTKEGTLLQWQYQKGIPLKLTSESVDKLTLQTNLKNLVAKFFIGKETLTLHYQPSKELFHGADTLTRVTWPDRQTESYSYRTPSPDRATLQITLRNGQFIFRTWDSLSNRLVSEEVLCL